jgi:hypothetical protein
MPYQLNKFNRSPLATVADGNIDTVSTSLTLVGKNFAGYGGYQNENFIYLLENFSFTAPPNNPLIGQVWYDSGAKKLRFYDTSYTGGSPEPTTYAKWRPVGAEIGTVAPTGLTIGDFWFDTSTKQLKAWNGATFTLIGPQVAGTYQTNLESTTVKDSLNALRPIVKAVVNGNTVFVISNSEFTLNNDEILTTDNEFRFIAQGITLANSNSGITDSNHRLWGTATNSEKLGGSAATNYVKKSGATFNDLAVFDNAGFTVGNVIKISNNDSDPVIENISSNTLSFKLKDGVSTRTPLILNGYNVIPGAKEGAPAVPVYNLGTSDDKWNNLYVKTINAETITVTGLGAATIVASKAETLYLGGSYVSATSANTPNTIVGRDGSGNFAANVIDATTARAKYADLAEKYDSDAVYEPGTVVVFGGDKEITVTDIEEDARVAGVISTNPAYLMNNDSDGLAVALRGKVPCKVVGIVQKGDILVSSAISGHAKAGNSASLPATIVGKSLENKFDDGIGIIMIVVT